VIVDEEDEPFGHGVEDALLVEALMRWDGEPCQCTECECLRFVDEANETWCRDCREGRHWGADGGEDGG
jgi:hypothetical protein